MFDNWNGEMGYMKINDQIVWAKEGKSNEKNGINICDGDYIYILNYFLLIIYLKKAVNIVLVFPLLI